MIATHIIESASSPTEMSRPSPSSSPSPALSTPSLVSPQPPPVPALINNAELESILASITRLGVHQPVGSTSGSSSGSNVPTRSFQYAQAVPQRQFRTQSPSQQPPPPLAPRPMPQQHTQSHPFPQSQQQSTPVSVNLADVDPSTLNTIDLRKELEALKRKNIAASQQSQPVPTSALTNMSPTLARYNEEVDRLRRELEDVRRKESELVAMQSESRRLAEEERKATELKQREIDLYYRTINDNQNQSLTLSSSALQELEAIQLANTQREAKLKAYQAEEQRLRALKSMAEDQYRIQRSVDVCFIVDCTSSMGKWIMAVKEKILDIVTAVKHDNDIGDVRVAFIGYRDYYDSERFTCMDFTTDVQAVRNFMTSVQPFGGDDIPEDMVGGLTQSLALSWRSRTRCAIIIADAPCHGEEFHAFQEDPRNATVQSPHPSTVLTTVRQQGIDLAFTRITKGTDRMIEKFRQYYDKKEEQRVFRVLQLGNSVDLFVPNIVQSITESITRVAALQGTIPQKPPGGARISV